MQKREFDCLLGQLFYFGDLDVMVSCAARNEAVRLALDVMGGDEAVIHTVANQLLAESEIGVGDILFTSKTDDMSHVLFAVVEGVCVEKKEFSVGLYGFPLGRVKIMTNKEQNKLIKPWIDTGGKRAKNLMLSALGRIWVSKQNPECELAIGACAIIERIGKDRHLAASFEGVSGDDLMFEYWVATDKEVAELRAQHEPMAA